ncbi:MAG: hypothetical protein BWX61_01330 [Bacteroidetes bacterium ADurb.Bin035]|nr:MAG: hypothetical protein BWX61_01330 [Bacteroidetes bacterium ADurb.Bin035]
MISPNFTASIGVSTIASFVNTFAVVAFKEIRSLISLAALLFILDSMYLPMRLRVMIIAATVPNDSTSNPAIARIFVIHAEIAPIDSNVSIFV